MAIQEAPAQNESAGSGGHPALLIPPRTRPHGPITASRLRRTLAGYAIVFAAGVVPVILDASAGWKAFGLGLVAPGGGFVFTSDLALAAMTLVVFVLTLALWFGAGNIVFPFVVWLGTAGLASLRVHTGIWSWTELVLPGLVVALFAVGAVAQRVNFRAAIRRAEARNQYLAKTAFVPPADPPIPALGPELAAADLAHARFLIDLALQPVDRFDGFDFVDQFQTAAVRYQLNFASYALGLLQYTRTPAFSGYVSQAQRNLIEKMTQKRVWSYWRLENLWGNFSYDPDPIPNDNIMLSAYLGVMLAAYEASNVDSRFDEPGSIVFRWNDKKAFAYDHHTIAEAVHRNFQKSPWGMFPCEPNWIYSACNTFGINTLLSHDRLHGTDYAAEVIDRFKHAVDVEFLTPDGRVTAIRSSRLGLTIPALTSTMADAGTALFLNPSLPATAQRCWQVVRTEFVDIADGVPKLELRGWDKLDVGNYKLGTDVSANAMVMAAALEIGDDEVYNAIRGVIDDKFEPVTRDGVLRYARASTQANCFLGMSRFGRRDGFRDLVTRRLPDAWLQGPVLAEAPYPDALVARAVTDGSALDLVLRPGAGAKRITLVVDRLAPGREYTVTGAVEPELVAGSDGRARLDVDLADRTVVRMVPRG